MSEMTLEDALQKNEAARKTLGKGWGIVLILGAVILVGGGLFAYMSRHEAHGMGALIFFAFPPLVAVVASIGLNIAGALARRKHVALEERPHATPEQVAQASRISRNITITRVVANLWVPPALLAAVSAILSALQ